MMVENKRAKASFIVLSSQGKCLNKKVIGTLQKKARHSALAAALEPNPLEENLIQ